MVRIKVIKKSQIIAGTLAAIAAAALLAGIWIAWRRGAFGWGGGYGGYAIDAGTGEYALNADAPADGMGAIPPTAAGAALSVSAMQGDLDGNAVYVVGVDFTAGAEDAQTDLAASSADAEGSSDQTAASLGAILAAGLSDDNRLGPLSGRSILIYHTHTHESYEKQPQDTYVEISAYRTSDADHSIVRVGEELTRLLKAMGASVYHDTNDYEQTALSTSYERSLKMLEQFKQDGRAFDLWIDMHRDAYVKGTGETLCAEIDGHSAAKLMVLLGTGEGTSGGEAFAQKPDFEKNLVWGQRLTDELGRIAPGICKKVLVKSGRYNQHISERCLLIEVGNNRNTLEEALNSMPYLARGIAATLAHDVEAD